MTATSTSALSISASIALPGDAATSVLIGEPFWLSIEARHAKGRIALLPQSIDLGTSIGERTAARSHQRTSIGADEIDVYRLELIAFAAPSAKQYQSTLTDPPVGSGNVIKITKPSKVFVKIMTGSVIITIRGSGVTDALDEPVNLNANTAQVDFIRPNGMAVNVMFGIDIVNGKIKATFPIGLSAFPGGPLVPGDAITVRGVSLFENGSGSKFAVSGLTTK